MTPSNETNDLHDMSDAHVVGGGGPGAPDRLPPGAQPSWVGKRVGRFKLVGLLGQGAMGRVFRVEDSLLQRYAALKVLPRTIQRGGKAVAVERLIREARAAATVEHPNAVTIYEVNESAGVHYIAMELIEGGTLRDLVKASGPLEYPRACLLCADAADALDHAHHRGIIHRDIKPTNLMLTRSGRCKVTDFGLARAEGAGDLSGRLPESVGTPQFLAPEIARGQPASAQSDIYSLGATLWYLLTGHPPFGAAAPAESLRRHANDPLPDLLALRPDLPAPLVQAITKALSKLPEQRFGSAAQFGRVLRVHTIPVEGSTATANLLAPDDDRRHSAARGPARKRALVALIGSAAILIIAASAFAPAALRAWRRPTVSAPPSPSPSASPSPVTPPVASTGAPISPNPTPPKPTTINLLDKLDVAAATVRGNWHIDGTDLVSESPGHGILEFPFVVPAEYDFYIEFTPNGGTVEQLLCKSGVPVGPGGSMRTVPFNWCMNAMPGICGLEALDGKHLRDLGAPTTLKQVLEIQRRHRSLVQVRKNVLRFYVDGQALLIWPTDFRNLSRVADWNMSDNTHLGLGSTRQPARFHRAELIDKAGEP
jgi:serine/threonine-protein kinase